MESRVRFVSVNAFTTPSRQDSHDDALRLFAAVLSSKMRAIGNRARVKTEPEMVP